MSYEVETGSILQISIVGSLYGQQTITTFNYQLLGGLDYDGPLAIEAAKTAINTAATGLYARYRAVTVQDLTALIQFYQWIAPVRWAYKTFIPGSRDGSIATPAGTPNIGAVVTRTADQSGRRYVSNLHIPGVPQAEYSDGFFTPEYLDLLQELGAESVAPIDVGGVVSLAPCTFRRSNPTEPAMLVNSIPQVTVRDNRRRTVGQGA